MQLYLCSTNGVARIFPHHLPPPRFYHVSRVALIRDLLKDALLTELLRRGKEFQLIHFKPNREPEILGSGKFRRLPIKQDFIEGHWKQQKNLSSETNLIDQFRLKMTSSLATLFYNWSRGCGKMSFRL